MDFLALLTLPCHLLSGTRSSLGLTLLHNKWSFFGKKKRKIVCVVSFQDTFKIDSFWLGTKHVEDKYNHRAERHVYLVSLFVFGLSKEGVFMHGKEFSTKLCIRENIHTKIICLYNMTILGASAWWVFSKKKKEKVLICIVIQGS